MPSLLARYTHWLHTCWPAGTVEKLPACDGHRRTNLPGVRIGGDLTGAHARRRGGRFLIVIVILILILIGKRSAQRFGGGD